MEDINTQKEKTELRNEILKLYDDTFEIKYPGIERPFIFRTDISNTEVDKTEGMNPQEILRFFIWKMSKDPILDPDTIKLMPLRMVNYLGKQLMPYISQTQKELKSSG